MLIVGLYSTAQRSPAVHRVLSRRQLLEDTIYM